MLCAFGGWLLMLAGISVAGMRLVCRADDRAATWSGLILAVLLLIGQTAVARRTERLFGHVFDGRPVAMALARGLGSAIHQYTEAAGHYPESLTELVKTDVVHPKNLVSPRDPGCAFSHSYADWPRGPIYSSYVYQAGVSIAAMCK